MNSRKQFPRLVLALLLSLLPASAAHAQADTPQPQKKDSPAFLIKSVEQNVTFSSEVTPATARPGETVTYTVTAKVQAPWHIYAYNPETPEEGPRPTQFDFFDPASLVPQGDWTPDHPPHEAPEPAFDNKVFGSYEDEVRWSRTLLVPADAAPGPRALRAQISFMMCNESNCTPPTRKTLADAVVTIAAAEGAPAASPTTVAPTAAAPPDTSPAVVSPTEKTPSDPTSAAVAEKLVQPQPNALQASGAATAPESEVERSIRQGLGPFLLLCVLGGLLALAMPCVWPMVPVTVNFFVKQGQKEPGSTTRLAITYSLAIIAIFTLVGLLFSAVLGATSLQRLANNPVLNIVVATIFLVFGLSLLGLFEIRLPSFLLNASARGESKGGLVGIIFMALTLTITSFTCTFPVVGGLLVLAAKGSVLYPILGLATFAAVLAFPFFLLALAPGLLSQVPRSGDWMNAVKVTGGLVEIGAAFKFLNMAEIGLGSTPENAWFDAQFVLTAWIALSAIAGIYLLGMFRTSHDHDAIRVGPIRMLSGIFFVFLALFFTPALFGSPPQSRLWYLMVGLMPADVGELTEARAHGSGPSPGAGKAAATSTDPAQAIREEKVFHGVQWGMSLDLAKEQARESGKPILIDFTGVNCANCRQMEQEVMIRPEVIALLEQFETVALYCDFVPISSISRKDREELATSNLEFQSQLVSDVTQPFYVAMSPTGEVLATIGGRVSLAAYQEFLQAALEKSVTAVAP